MLFFKEHLHHLLKSKINKKIKEQKYFTPTHNSSDNKTTTTTKKKFKKYFI